MVIPRACEYIIIEEVGGVMDRPQFFENAEHAQRAIDFFHSTYATHDEGHANITVIELPDPIAHMRYWTATNADPERDV